jgi:phenylacetate-CoA ligase
MSATNFESRRRAERLTREELAEYQLRRLNHLLETILPHNRFYAEKLASLRRPLRSLDELAHFPYTNKEDLMGEAPMCVAQNLTYPMDHYVRFHRTSGTRGRPMAVLDTAEDWQWWLDTWQFVLDAAQLEASDRVAMLFSFGPFIGFWSANDALVARGCMTLPCGGMGTLARLEMLRTARATAICCTPSYALHAAEVAHEQKIDLRALEVRKIIVAGEPGGSVPAMRERLETAWSDQVIDHAGATEIGPWGYSDPQGLRIVETEFLTEFLSHQTGHAAREGELAELVLTTLGRYGSPVLRYRTGDLVRPIWQTDGENRFVLLEGGVLGRTDDMMIIRGVNVFPTAVEQILCGFPEVVEYRLTARKRGAMDTLTIEIEDRLNRPERVAQDLNLRLGLHVEVQSVPLGSLPRFEAKGRRFIDERRATADS